MARAAPWLALVAVYALAVIGLDADDPAVQAPRLIDELRDAIGAQATDLVLAAVTALTFGVAAELARIWVPDPWATRGVLVAALSPAAFALSTSTAAAPALLLTVGTLLAIRTRDHPTRGRALGGGACLAFAPWFGIPFAAPAAIVLFALVHWAYRRGRRLNAFLALELAGASIVTLAGVSVSEPVAAAPGVRGVLEVVFSAPILLLVPVTGWLLARSRREHLSRAIPARRDAEVAAGLTGAAVAVLVVTATFEPIAPEAGVALAAACGAWALRAFPRSGALLSLATLALTAWTAVALATGDVDTWLRLGLP